MRQVSAILKLRKLVLLSAVILITFPARAAQDSEFIRQLSKESEQKRADRHQRIAQRRAGPIVIVHRGASAIAPENTIEAYAAAMDLGADGCEVDLRLTRDGVIVMFHDDMLDHLTESLGDMGELTFHQSQLLQHRLRYGRKLPSTAPPTFVALLQLARQRAMLLHLDVKMIGMEEYVSRLLDEADAWDHIVAVNGETAPKLARHPKLRPLKYLGGLYENRRDMDPSAVAAMLPKPGEMIIVDDPRVAAAALRRSYRPVALPPALCIPLARETGAPAPAYEGTNFNLFAFSKSLGRLEAGEAFVVLTRDFPDAARPADDTAQERERTEWIVRRAWAAQNVVPSWNSERLRFALQNVVRTRSLHSNWRFQGLDGAAAVRALARLKDTSAVPLLISTLCSVDPALSRVSNMAQFGNYPMSWHDAVFKMYIIPALGELPGVETAWFLLGYIDRPEADVRAWAPPQWEEATKALLKQELTAEDLNSILTNTNSAVRGTAIVELLANKIGPEALRKAAPWTLKLPGPEK